MNGAITTKIRYILMPSKGQQIGQNTKYVKVDEVSASAAVRIVATDELKNAVAGGQCFVVSNKAKLSKLKKKAQKNLNNLSQHVDKSGDGVFVTASTLGALEALISFLKQQGVKVCGFELGDVSKKTVTKVLNLSNLQIIIAFDVKIASNVREYAKCQRVKIIESDILYHLEMELEKVMNLRRKKEKMSCDLAVFPVEFELISPEHIFRRKNPLVIGVKIRRGCLRLNTPICVKRKQGPLYLGKVIKIECNNKEVDKVKMGNKASICIQGEEEQKNIQIGRSFEICDLFVSKISRESIDSLKDNYEDEMKKGDKDLIPHIVELMKYFGIPSRANKKRRDDEEEKNDE